MKGNAEGKGGVFQRHTVRLTGYTRAGWNRTGVQGAAAYPGCPPELPWEGGGARKPTGGVPVRPLRPEYAGPAPIFSDELPSAFQTQFPEGKSQTDGKRGSRKGKQRVNALQIVMSQQQGQAERRGQAFRTGKANSCLLKGRGGCENARAGTEDSTQLASPGKHWRRGPPGSQGPRGEGVRSLWAPTGPGQQIQARNPGPSTTG